MTQAMPVNCEARDELEQVSFDLVFEGQTWKAAISYGLLARMFSAPNPRARVADMRESRQALVRHSKQIARLVIERVRDGAKNSSPIVIL